MAVCTSSPLIKQDVNSIAMKLATGARQLVAGPARERVEAHAKVPADSHETAKKAHMPLKSCVCIHLHYAAWFIQVSAHITLRGSVRLLAIDQTRFNWHEARAPAVDSQQWWRAQQGSEWRHMRGHGACQSTRCQQTPTKPPQRLTCHLKLCMYVYTNIIMMLGLYSTSKGRGW